jgi:hypothetical protein
LRRIVVKVNWWKVLHWILIIVFLQGALYAAYMMFFVVGGGGPLFHRAVNIPAETIFVRRLYAYEFYLNAIGLAIYLGITEIIPRKLTQIQGEER